MRAPQSKSQKPTMADQLRDARAELAATRRASEARIAEMTSQHSKEIAKLASDIAESERVNVDLVVTVRDLKTELMQATIESAKMSGYITRINESDPRPVPVERRYGVDGRNTIMENRAADVRETSSSRLSSRDTYGLTKVTDVRQHGWWNRG